MCVMILTKKDVCLRGGTITNTMKMKQSELYKVNVWLREDYLRLRWKWTEEVGKGANSILLSM